jgi:hypothetical protein
MDVAPLSDGDTYDLEIAPVRKRLGDATVRSTRAGMMLSFEVT